MSRKLAGLRNGAFETHITSEYAVNGTGIPEVDFDIGESYAGLLPISSSSASSQLYFWFFPSSNPAASDEITIWLNGGPGCSSLEGLLQENGPFLWQYGTFKPVQNQWSWSKLTNMVSLERCCTGRSTAKANRKLDLGGTARWDGLHPGNKTIQIK